MLPLSEKPAPASALPVLIWHHLVRWVTVLLPVYVSTTFFSHAADTSFTGKWRPTSYLDGLKGLASWFVFNTHLAPLLSQTIGAGYGHQNGHSWLQFPLIHFIHAGGFPIHIFFLVNGFIISGSAVKQMNAASLNEAGMIRKLSTTIFTRPFRLFMPSMASTLVSFLLIRLDLFNTVNNLKNDSLITGWGVMTDWPAKQGSFFQQLGDVLFQAVRMTRILERNEGIDYPNKYNPVLWTTPVQFQGTLLLSIAHAATFYVPARRRLWIVLAIIALAIAGGQFIMLSFLFGWLLAEIIPLNAVSNDENGTRRVSKLRASAWTLVLVFALYLASYPRFEPEFTSGFRTLYALTPPSLGVTSDLWHSIAAALTVLCVRQLPFMSSLLSRSFMRYLGRVSFGLYLTHLWSTHLVGSLIYSYVWETTGREDPLREMLGFGVAYAATFFVNVWVAEVWARTAEAQCTAFAGWIKGKMLVRLE